jgi:hypothetical protein
VGELVGASVVGTAVGASVGSADVIASKANATKITLILLRAKNQGCENKKKGGGADTKVRAILQRKENQFSEISSPAGSRLEPV